MARMTNLNLVLHFDTKKLEKVQEDLNIKIITKRLVLYVSWHDTENLIYSYNF